MVALATKKTSAVKKPAARKSPSKPRSVKPPAEPEPAVQELGQAENVAEKTGAKGPDRVESFDVFAEPHKTVLTLNGKAYELDREALLAVAKLLDAARVETNY